MAASSYLESSREERNYKLVTHMLFKSSKELLRQFLLQSIGSSTLTAFLKEHKSTIDTSEDIRPQDKDILYPPNGGKTDIKEWDLTLTAFILNVLVTPQKAEQKEAIRAVLELGQKYTKMIFEMDENEFFLSCRDIMKVLDDSVNTLLDDPGNFHLQDKYTEMMLEKAGDDAAYGVDETNDGTHLPMEILRMDSQSVEMYKKALADGKVSVHNIRVMLVGHSGVGKTTLLNRLLKQPVKIGERESTEGIDVRVCQCKVDIDTGQWINSEGETQNETSYLLARSLRFSGDDIPIESNHPRHETTASQSDVQEDDVVNQYPSGNSIDDARQPEAAASHSSDHQSHSADINNEKVEHLTFVKEFVQARSSVPDKQYASVSFWDFAGQSIFYNTHQVFLAHRTIYLLVTNIDEKIDEIVTDDENDAMKNYGKTVEDFVDFWVNSIHFFGGKETVEGPPVLLIATHADKLDAGRRKERTDSHFERVRDMFEDKVTAKHIVDDYEFAIDNTRQDEQLQALKKAIFDVAKRQDYWGEQRPARWITLEQELDKLRQKEKTKILKVAEVEDINQRLPVPLTGTEEITLFLRFQSDTGNYLYISGKELGSHVLLDPKWVINAIKCIITAEPFIKKKMKIRPLLNELNKTGKLTMDLIDAVWGKQECPFMPHKDFLLLLMERLNLIARLKYGQPEQVPDHYFVPCIIKAQPKDLPCDSGSQSSSTLILTVPSRFFPVVIFNKLIASCIERFRIRRINKDYHIYNGCAVFEVQDACVFTLRYIENGIKVWVTCIDKGNTAQFINDTGKVVLPFLVDAIKRVLVQGEKKGENEVDIFAVCPKSPDGKIQDKFELTSNIDDWKNMKVPTQVCDAHAGDPHDKEELLRNWIPCDKNDSAARKLALNDDTKKEEVKSGALQNLVRLCQNGNQQEKYESIHELWGLTFDEVNRKVICRDSNRDVVDLLMTLRSSENPGIKKGCDGALWNLRDVMKVSSNKKYQQIAEEQEAIVTKKPDTKKSHIMISYQWDNQDLMIRVKDELQKEGYKVWMDIDEVKGSLLQSMAEGVENAFVVLISMTSKYKNSLNCRSEAEYAYQTRKEIIPLKLEKDYTPDGWLGILAGTKLFFEFTDRYPFDKKLNDLVKEINSLKAKLAQPCSERPI